MDEDCTVIPESSHDIEVEPQQQGNDGIEQGVVTQEPASLSVLVQMAEKMGEEPGMEDTLELNEELCTITPECSHDTEIVEEELQQQGDEEVSQDVATQEPTSLEVVARTLEMQLEDNLEVDIIPDMHWSEDEQVQTQSSGNTEILEEHSCTLKKTSNLSSRRTKKNRALLHKNQ